MNYNIDGNLAYKPETYHDSRKAEIVDGRVVMMATPTSNHNRVAGNIHTIFDVYLDGKPCEPFGDNEALFLEEGREEYRPDMMVVCDPEKVKNRGVFGAPDLVVEVLSRSTARYDRGHKRDIYEAYGVREYWIVDPVRLSVEQYVLENGKFVLRDVYHHYTAAALAEMTEEERAAIVTEFPCALFSDLTIHLDRVFRRVSPPF